jgi:hypothetical protein
MENAKNDYKSGTSVFTGWAAWKDLNYNKGEIKPTVRTPAVLVGKTFRE